jgi:hypothetical protein
MSTTSHDSTGLPHLRDADGAPIPFQGQVEQVAVDEEHGALFSRLHQRGEVVGRDTNLVLVRFESDRETVALQPELVRVLSTDGA